MHALDGQGGQQGSPDSYSSGTVYSGTYASSGTVGSVTAAVVGLRSLVELAAVRRWEARVPGDMDLAELHVCRTPAGRDWVLGQGTFGTVWVLMHRDSECRDVVGTGAPKKFDQAGKISWLATASGLPGRRAAWHGMARGRRLARTIRHGHCRRVPQQLCTRPWGRQMHDWTTSGLTLRQVYKALRHGTSEVAVKHIPCVVDDPQKLHQLRREVAIMQRISYDRNVVQFYGACMNGAGAWLCMEYMEVGRSASQLVLGPHALVLRCVSPAATEPITEPAPCSVTHAVLHRACSGLVNSSHAFHRSHTPLSGFCLGHF